jgi:hypothetical protein
MASVSVVAGLMTSMDLVLDDPPIRHQCSSATFDRHALSPLVMIILAQPT